MPPQGMPPRQRPMRPATSPRLPVEDQPLLWLSAPQPTGPPLPPVGRARRLTGRTPRLVGIVLLAVAAVAAALVLLVPWNHAEETSSSAPDPTATGEAAPPAVVTTGAITVAVTDSGVLTSADGRNWTPSAGAPQLFRIAASDGLLVGVGSSSVANYPDTVYTSTDGISWQQQLRVTEARLADVVHDDTGWLVVGTSVTASPTGVPIWSYRSPDGTTWSRSSAEILQSAPVGFTLTSLAYGNGRWILGATGAETPATTGDPNTVPRYIYAVSDNGLTWRTNIPVEFTSQTRFAWNGTAWGFVGRKTQEVSAAAPNRLYSVSGLRVTLSTPGVVSRVEPEGLLVDTLTWVQADQHWLATGTIGSNSDASALYVSTDLAHWDLVATPSGANIVAAAVLTR
jgi:hypothetical protein